MAFDNHVERVHAKGRDSECLGLSMVEYTPRFSVKDAALALNHARKGNQKKVIEVIGGPLPSAPNILSSADCFCEDIAALLIRARFL
jgi:hypothetical protein